MRWSMESAMIIRVITPDLYFGRYHCPHCHNQTKLYTSLSQCQPWPSESHHGTFSEEWDTLLLSTSHVTLVNGISSRFFCRT